MVGHEGKCRFLHGHNYRAHLTVRPSRLTSLDEVGRVIDFGSIKATLCEWIEEFWDHKFLVWADDPLREALLDFEGVVVVPFNPTAENMAQFLVEGIAPHVLPPGVELIRCVLEETRKCSATYEKE